MRCAVLIFVLCLIAPAEIACSRRTARAVRLPSASDAVGDPRHRHRASTNEMRAAIESLKNKLHRAPDEPAAAGLPGAVSQSGDVANPGTGVGTSGALSVETRYPAQPNGATSHPSPRTHLLSRAGYALRWAVNGMSVWVVGLCGLAAALMVALLLRRSNSSA